MQGRLRVACVYFYFLPAIIAALIPATAVRCQQTPRPANGPAEVPPVRPFYFKDHDSSYYQSFERYVTTRAYISQKYGGFELGKSAAVGRYRYLPNTTVTVGIGITYQSISVNVGYGFGFLNRDVERGKTSYMDLQTHIYGRKWTTDLTGQVYKGYYLTPKGLAATGANPFYLRPDMHSHLFGVSAYRLLNPERFSYRAALLENEKQRKSAGSLSLGAEVYYGSTRADSAFVPKMLSSAGNEANAERLVFFKIGPGIAYAYTFVIHNDFFLTGSLTGNLSLDFSKEYTEAGSTGKFNLNKGFIYRLVAGYDKNNWNANLSLVGNQLTVTGSGSTEKYLYSNGTFRLTIAKRLTPGRRLSQKLHPVDNMIKKVHGYN